MVKVFACRVALFVLKVVTHPPYDAGSFLQSCGVPPPALWVMAGGYGRRCSFNKKPVLSVICCARQVLAVTELQTTAVLRRVGILDVFAEPGKIADIKQEHQLTAGQVALQHASATGRHEGIK